MFATKKKIETSLSGLYSERECKAIAMQLLESILQMSRTEILCHWDKSLSIEEMEKIDSCVDRLKQAEPLQYVLGETQFAGLTMGVRKGVLIPRPETEELVHLIAREYAGTECSIIDIGTGSGCIAVSLAHWLPLSKVSAVDVSLEALKIAKENAQRNRINVDFIALDILKDFPEGKWDVIVSNPPYIMEKEKETMQSNVLDYEPSLALFVSDHDPLLFYRRIAQCAAHQLSKEGTLYFEINEALGEETKSLLHECGFNKVQIIKDFFQKDRIIKAQR